MLIRVAIEQNKMYVCSKMLRMQKYEEFMKWQKEIAKNLIGNGKKTSQLFQSSVGWSSLNFFSRSLSTRSERTIISRISSVMMG